MLPGLTPMERSRTLSFLFIISWQMLSAWPLGALKVESTIARLQDQVLRELRLLASYEAEHQAVRQQVRQLYR